MIGRMAIVTDAALRRLATRIGEQLRAARLSIATAESCTGGLLAKCLTDIAGSSDYFERGWVSYSNAAKQSGLGVAGSLIRREGAVSEAVAFAMAAGALRRSRARVSIAVTGIAGPGGATAGKPVGTVWIAWGLRRRGRIEAYAARFRFRGSRDAVRRQSVAAALEGLPAS
jgi:nicotinamide-nucleotide amidase